MYRIYTMFCLLLLLGACNQDIQSNNTETDTEKAPSPADLSGFELAQIHCSSCHDFPEPELLDRNTWSEYVLPRMGYRLGIYPNDSIRATLIEEGPGGNIVEEANIYPRTTLLGPDLWEKIQQYYLDNAPQTLPGIPAKNLNENLTLFKYKPANYRLSPPSVTLAHFSDAGPIYVGDANTKAIYQFSPEFQLQNAANVREGAVWLQESESSLYVTVMGSFSPTDAPNGLLLELPKVPSRKAKVLLGNLQRPVHSVVADLNGDGRQDIVTCEFAKWTGALSWWEQMENGSYSRTMLRDQPGAIKAYVRDMNADNLPDIIALFGQGDEGIWIFYNEGNGSFREEKVITFESTYGSCYFNLFDYNGDDHPDLIYAAGDNADYPPLYKPYHGIRIFENDGNNRFKEVLFYQMNGAYAAIPSDFDQDGDMDIAAISFFPNFSRSKKEGFIFLENQGNMTFEAYTFPQVDKGRWIVMDAGDPDQDGDTDLILGSLAFEVVPAMGLVQQWVNDGIPFVVLENTTK